MPPTLSAQRRERVATSLLCGVIGMARFYANRAKNASNAGITRQSSHLAERDERGPVTPVTRGVGFQPAKSVAPPASWTPTPQRRTADGYLPYRRSNPSYASIRRSRRNGQ